MSPAAEPVDHPALLLLGLVQATAPDDLPGSDLAAAAPILHPAFLLLGLAETASPTTDGAAS